MYLIVISILIGYLMGSINPAIILSKIKGKDIRQLGSGNAGATNTLRNYGKKAALTVTLCDVLKCIVAFFLAKGISAIAGGSNGDLLYSGVAASVGCILGHNFPLYFSFKGGKGVLVSVTALFLLDWIVGLIALAAFIIVFAAFKYVSLGSICGAVVAAVASCFISPSAICIFTVFAAVLTIIRHKTNIVRLVKGTESKTSLGNKKEEIK